MNRAILASTFLLIAAPAFADPVATNPVLIEKGKTDTATPTCGKTVTECAATLQKQIDQLTTAYQATRQQRDQAMSQFSDAQVSAYVAAQPKK